MQQYITRYFFIFRFETLAQDKRESIELWVHWLNIVVVSEFNLMDCVNFWLIIKMDNVARFFGVKFNCTFMGSLTEKTVYYLSESTIIYLLCNHSIWMECIRFERKEKCFMFVLVGSYKVFRSYYFFLIDQVWLMRFLLMYKL